MKDILLQLPSFNARSPQANELCQAILLKAKDSRSLDMETGTTTTLAPLNRTRPYLDLLRVIFLEKQLGDLESLLRFYQPLVSKPVLQRLPPQDQVFVISNFAETVAAVKGTNQQSTRNVLAFSSFCFDVRLVSPRKEFALIEPLYLVFTNLKSRTETASQSVLTLTASDRGST